MYGSIPDDQGRIVVIEGAPVDAGLEIVVNQTIRTRWRILSVSALFTAAVAVATRLPALSIIQDTQEIGRYEVNDVFLTGEVGRVTWGPAVGTNIPLGSPNKVGALPVGLLVNREAIIRTATMGIQLMDQWSDLNILVEEWIEQPI